MLTQWIFTAIVVLAAMIYAMVRIRKFFSKPKKPAGSCRQFDGDCHHCPLHGQNNTSGQTPC